MFLTECLLAILLIVVACCTRHYWCGGALLFVLCLGFGLASPSRDLFGMCMVPFIFGLPVIVMVRGRYLASLMSPLERERRADEAAQIYGPDPAAAWFFAFLALVTTLRMSSAWTIVDLDGARVRVEQRSWWGLSVEAKEFPQDAGAKVELTQREYRTVRGNRLMRTVLVFRQPDGKVLGTTGGGSWGFNAQDDVNALNAAIRKGREGRFHKRSFVRIGPLSPFLMAFLTMVLVFGRGLVRPRKPRTPSFPTSSREVGSLAGVSLWRGTRK